MSLQFELLVAAADIAIALLVATFTPWIVIHIDAERLATGKGKPICKLCPLS